ncbi:MAG: hypothetical protein DHS20C21_22740 [Gemmatimonadota bacterium]|nr:MAG: hypothetical protein DHS20C21_22740 [Gemmatimonadota bacterium]
MPFDRRDFLRTSAAASAAAGCALLSAPRPIRAEPARTEDQVLAAVDSGPHREFLAAILAEDSDTISALGRADLSLVHRMHPDFGTPLHVAVSFGKAGSIQALRALHADYNRAAGPQSLTAVRAALEFHDRAVAERMAATMMENGGDVRVSQGDGTSILHACVRLDSADLVRLSLRKGADPNQRDDAGRTPLELARELGLEEVSLLLANESSVARDHTTSRFRYHLDGSSYHHTPNALPMVLVNDFSMAAHGDYDRVREMLLETPELLNAEASWVELPVEAAAHMDRPADARFLAGKGAPVSICTAAMLGENELVKRMLRDDPDRVRERGAHDIPLSWYPVMDGGKPDVARTLLAAGLDPDMAKRGTTALHHAARLGHVEIAGIFLEAGADATLTLESADGPLSALDLAKRNEHAEVADLLRANGAG